MQFDFVIRFDFGIDVLQNEGYFRIRLFYITLLQGRLYFKAKKNYGVFVLQWKNRTIELHLNNDNADKQSVITVFTSYFFSSIKLSKLATKVSVGKCNDALFTMVVLQTLRTFLSAFLSAIKTKKNVEIYDQFIAKYNNDEFKVAVSSIIEVSFANIIVNVIERCVKNAQKGGNKIDNRA